MESSLILVEREGKILSLLYRQNRLIQAHVYTKEIPDLNSIYIGKIKNIMPSLNSAFVEYRPGVMGFLSLKQLQNPLLTNRKFDGHLVAGDEIVVQVEKEKSKQKAAGLSCNLSFSGKYSVITTEREELGFSNKLPPNLKAQLKKTIRSHPAYERLRQNRTGLIIRTNTKELQDTTPLFDEIETLFEKQQYVLKQAYHRTCFSLLFGAPKPYLTGIRDLYSHAYDRILTDNEEIYQEIKSAFPEEKKLSFYQDEHISLSHLYSIDTRLQEALAEKVWLKSGGYLIIQPTEALTVIDVNSGKIQKKKPEKHFFHKLNLEAAEEIAIQLILRNISGIIIIDFINQSSKTEDEELLKFLTKSVSKDAIQTKVMGMTALGLVEVTRKKINRPLWEQLQ